MIEVQFECESYSHYIKTGWIDKLVVGSLTDKRRVLKKPQSEPTLTKSQRKERDKRIAWYRLQNEVVEAGQNHNEKTLFQPIPQSFRQFRKSNRFWLSAK